MNEERLKSMVRQSLKEGTSLFEIKEMMRHAGWSEKEIDDVVDIDQYGSKWKTIFYGGIIAFFVCVGSIASFYTIDSFYYGDRLSVRYMESALSFIDADELVFPDEEKMNLQKETYMKEKIDFIEVDLREMTVTLYDKGLKGDQFTVISKGEERSWWETPTGNYKVLTKSPNWFSSIGHVWMPYSIQFYGNYFIHGWPYYPNGNPVPEGYSGGCVRLNDEDAEKIFTFAQKDMPILVLEAYDDRAFGTLEQKGSEMKTPDVDAEAFLVINLITGETLIEKNSNIRLPIASLTKLMTGVVAHEVIYLGRNVTVSTHMLASLGGSHVFKPVVGDQYNGLDLLYPLLMQSSNEAAEILSGYIGRNNFVGNMNVKARSLEMKDTTFVDASGIDNGNISTAKDIVKLLQYIYYKRPFLFDITKGIVYENVGILPIGTTIHISDLKNYNEYVEEEALVGVKNGETTKAKQTLAMVWNIQTDTGEVPVAIIVLGTHDRKADTDKLLSWLRKNYE